MPRKKQGVTAGRARDAKGRLLPADAKAPKVTAAQQPPQPEPGPVVNLPMPAVVPSMWTPNGGTEVDGLYPSLATWRQLHEIGQTILESGMKPAWIHTIQQMVTVLLRGYELRVGPSQILWNTYLGDDGRLLNTAELMRSLVQRSGAGYLRPVRRDNEEVTYEAVRYGATPEADVKVTVTWHVGMLPGGPLKGQPRQTLDARATSEICRTLFADIAGGYTPEDFDRPTGPPQARPTPPPPPTTPPPAEPVQPVAVTPPAPEPPAVTPEAPPAQASPPKGAKKAPTEPAAPPAPSAKPEAPAQVAPPVSAVPGDVGPDPKVPGYGQEVLPGRKLVRLVQVPMPDGTHAPRYTAGISADQIGRIFQVAGEQYQEVAQKWLGSKKLKGLSWCTEEEGAELIVMLTGIASGAHTTLGVNPANPTPELTRERALHIFSREMGKLEFDVDQALRYVAQKTGVMDPARLLPEQIVQAAEDFRAMAAADLNSFKIAFARETDRMGIDPQGGSGAPF